MGGVLGAPSITIIAALDPDTQQPGPGAASATAVARQSPEHTPSAADYGYGLGAGASGGRKKRARGFLLIHQKPPSRRSRVLSLVAWCRRSIRTR